jgi:membrane protease YdiL (CAAX protease family)
VNNTTFNSFSPIQLLLLFIGVTFISAILFSFLGASLASFLFDIQLNEIALRDYAVIENIRAVKLITLFSHLGMFIVPSFLLLYIAKTSFLDFFIPKQLGSRYWWIIPILLIGVSLLSEWSLYLNEQIDFNVFSQKLANDIAISQAERDETIQAFIGGTWRSFLVNTFLIALVPAIGEELTFRGVLQPLLIRVSDKKHATVIFVAFVFAFIHFQFMDFIPRFVLGIVYGYVYYYSKNIFSTILLHFFNNFLALSIAFYAVRNQQDLMTESSGNIFILITGLVFTIGGLLLIQKK